MSDALKHECGIALMRLRKPVAYYVEKYKSYNYAIERMFLLMQKQQNRGQDGAGFVSLKLDMPSGVKNLSRLRSNDQEPIQEIFSAIEIKQREFMAKQGIQTFEYSSKEVESVKLGYDYFSELYLGHLRYGTYGSNSLSKCHPFLRKNNWQTRNLVLAGNFNLTNVDKLFNHLLKLGQQPVTKADTTIVIEKIGHFLDEENQRLYNKYFSEGIESPIEIYKKIEENLDIVEVLKNATKYWDGGFAMAGMIGHGDSFVLRDPRGIRPVYYYASDELVVVASEKPVIQTALNVKEECIIELPPGHTIIIKKSGDYNIARVFEEEIIRKCSFERIYFSRGNDRAIYTERKSLGRHLAQRTFDAVDQDIDNTVFSYIPNTAETSFFGMTEEINNLLNVKKRNVIVHSDKSEKVLDEILNQTIRIEKVIIKDKKLRTFISDVNSRSALVAHTYDVTYGIIKETDALVVMDDSIVRGTTLKRRILAILSRLNPKKIIIVSSAPQIRYPDCYGIDMSEIGNMIAFQAAISLAKEQQPSLIEKVYEKCIKSIKNRDYTVNHVKEIYNPFTQEEIATRIADLLKPDELTADVKIVYQTKEGLRASCPENTGDWYFFGNYPTPGGVRVVNLSFVYWYEGVDKRPY